MSVGLFAGMLIVATMILLLKETISRNFGMPSSWPGEITTILVLWIFLMPMAFSQLDGGMIRVTFLVEKLPQKIQRWMRVLASFSGTLFGLLLFKSSLRFYMAVVPGSQYPVTHFPAAIQRGIIPICAILLAVAGLICVFRDILNLRLFDKPSDNHM